jgi:hypothetical protein
MFKDPVWLYISNSFHITVFFQSAVAPFVVYYRVISNFSGPGHGAKTTTAKKGSDMTANHVNNPNGRSCDYSPENQNGKIHLQKFV